MRQHVSQAVADLCALAGSRLVHITAAENLAGIRARGLLPVLDLAKAVGEDPAAFLLRKDRVRVGGARLNHQRPILIGLAAAHRMLEGHTPESWAEQLDARVFLWPEGQGRRFARSVQRDVDSVALWFDTAKLAELLWERIELSPLNSGNFTQGGAHARRGDWLFVPLQSGAEAFRTNRLNRGLVRGRDGLREVSLRGAIARDIVNVALVEVTRV